MAASAAGEDKLGSSPVRCDSPPPISFLSVSITDDETVTEKGLLPRSYVRYMVTTSFKRSTAVGSSSSGRDGVEELTIWRRYREFDLLRQNMTLAYPFIIVPPLPGKKWSLDAAQSAIVKQRSVALQSFLERCIVHPVLSQDDGLGSFLCEPAVFQRPAQAAAGSGEMPLIQLSNVGGLSDSQLQGVDTVAVKTAECIEQTMLNTKKVAALNQRQCRCFFSMSEQLRGWSLVDRDLDDPLAISSGKYARLGEAGMDHWKSQHELTNRVLNEYLLYNEALRQVLQRGSAVSSGEASGGSYSIASYLFSGGSNSQPSRNPAVNPERDQCADEARRSVLAEVTQLDAQRTAELRQMWREYARSQVVHLRKELSNWLTIKESFQPIADAAVD